MLQTTPRWLDASTAEYTAVYMQRRDHLHADIESRLQLLTVRSARAQRESKLGVMRFASGLRSNGVAIASAWAAASIIGYGSAQTHVLPPVKIFVGDSRTASNDDSWLRVAPIAPLSSAWHQINRSIDHWEQLQSDWDGDGAAPPSPFALESAREFLRTTMESGIQPPKPFIAADGEIGFRWRKGDAIASVSFLDDKHIVVFCMEPKLSQPIKIDEEYKTELDFTRLFESLASFE